MIKRIKQHAITIIIIFVILVINVMAYYQYTNKISEHLLQQTDSHLDAVISETIKCINIKLEERLESYKAVATFIGTLNNVDSKSIERALINQSGAAGYLTFDMIGSTGVGLESKGSTNYTDNVNYNKAMSGKNVIDVRIDEYGSVKGIEYYVPIYRSGQVKEVLMTYSSLEQFTTYMDISDLGKYGNVFIVKQDGTLLTRGNGLDEVSNIGMLFENDKAASEIVNSMQSRKSGYISYNSEESKIYICYAKTEYNKWYMVSIIPASSVEVSNDDITSSGEIFFVEIAVLTGILLIYLVRMVVVEGQGNKINKQRYYTITRYSDSIIFDYSREKDTMYCNEKWKEILGYEPDRENLRQDRAKYIADEDKDRYQQIVDTLLAEEKEYVKFPIAIKNSEGNPVNCIMKLFTIKGKRGKVQKILGVIEPCSQNV